MVRRGIAFMPREAVLRIDGVPLFHTGVAVPLLARMEAAAMETLQRVSFDQRLSAPSSKIELHGVNEQVIGFG